MKKVESTNKKKFSNLGYVFKNIIWPRRFLILIGLVLIVFNRAAGLVLPYSTKYLIDDIIGPNKIELLTTLLLVVGTAVSIQAVTSYSLTRLLSVEAQRLISILRSQVQQHIVKLPVSYFDNNKTGALVSRIMSDVEGVRNLVGTGLVQLFGGVLTSIASFFFLLNLNYQMTLVVLLPMLVFGVVSFKAFQYIRPIFRNRSKINARVTGRLTETLGGIRVIKGFNAEEAEISVFKKGVHDLYQNVKKSLTSTSLITSSGTFLIGLASIIIMKMGGESMYAGDMTNGDFFAYLLFLGFLVAPIVQMGNIGSQLTEAFAGLDRMEELLNEPTEYEDPKRTTSLKSLNGDIVFDKVNFEYTEGAEVLHEVSFEAKQGSVTALVGTSGSGKSTIAGLVGSFIFPSSGKIMVGSTDLSEVELQSYRSKLGVVLQDDFLFEGTIKENILFANTKASDQELKQAVEMAYVNEFTDRFDEGLETLIGERGIKLSGGQRQRIAIARAILANPELLILDEATSNLDASSEAFIQKSLKYLLQNRTTFVIAHRLSTIRQADQILVIENGRVAESGTHESLLEKKGRYYELYTYQARI